MQVVLIAAPTVEPVTLAEAKDQLRVLHGNEDSLIGRLVRTARVYVETILGRALVQQTVRLELSAFPTRGVIELPRPPVTSVTSVKYRDTAYVLQTLAPTEYVFTADQMTPRLTLAAGGAWPATYDHSAAVQVDFTAGYGALGSDVPDPIRHAILLITEHYYANRGATAEGTRTVLPMAVDMLLSPYRTTGWI